MTPLWAKAIGFFVATFPAVDVTSAIPLGAITLGNNLMAMVVPTKHMNNRMLKILFRLIAVVPPFAGALLVNNLLTSTTI